MSTANKGYVGSGSNGDDMRATNDPDGTVYNGGGGNDTLRGGRYDDLLTGGADNDKMFGGDGADEFRFFGNQISGDGDSDEIYDLDFSEGDLLVFGQFGSGTFATSDGVNSFNGGSAARISSYDGIVDVVNGSGDVGAFRQGLGNDTLVLRVRDADGQIQDVLISNGWSAYVAAGGVTDALSSTPV